MNFPELGRPQILTRKRALYTSSNAHPHTHTTTNRNFLGDLLLILNILFILETGEPIEYAIHCYWWSSNLFVYVQSLTLVYVNDST